MTTEFTPQSQRAVESRPGPATLDRSPRPEASDRDQRMFVEGLDRSVELRRAANGFWQVWPRPTPASLRALYQEEFYENDKASYLEDVERERPYWDAIWTMRRRLIEAALPASRRRLLDVGSSGGFLLDHFRQHGFTPFGIEPSPHAARFSRRHFGLDVFCGEILDYPLDHTRMSSLEQTTDTQGDAFEYQSGFDVIHCAQVLEHVLEPEACVARIASLLAPGGVAYIEVPNDFNTFQRTARDTLGKRSWWVAPGHHLNYFDYDSLASLLARHGLVEIDRLATFPIEMFLLMGEDYIDDPETGSACHARRMQFEHALIDAGRLDDLAAFYRSLATASLGRTCALLVRKPDATEQSGDAARHAGQGGDDSR